LCITFRCEMSFENFYVRLRQNLDHTNQVGPTFSKSSSILDVIYKVNVELPFENFYYTNPAGPKF